MQQFFLLQTCLLSAFHSMYHIHYKLMTWHLYSQLFRCAYNSAADGVNLSPSSITQVCADGGTAQRVVNGGLTYLLGNLILIKGKPCSSGCKDSLMNQLFCQIPWTVSSVFSTSFTIPFFPFFAAAPVLQRRLRFDPGTGAILIPGQNLPDHSIKAVPDSFPWLEAAPVPGALKTAAFPRLHCVLTGSDMFSILPALP